MDNIDDTLTKIGLGKFNLIILLILGNQYGISYMQILTYILLGPNLRCLWKISDFELFAITTGSFVGLMIGSLVFGTLSDYYGRKTSLMLSDVVFIYSTIMSVMSPTTY